MSDAADNPASGISDLEHQHPVTELLAQYQGATSPFGDDLQLPVDTRTLSYTHPPASEMTSRTGNH